MSKNLKDEIDEDTDSDDQDYVPEGDVGSADESVHDSNDEDESGDENLKSNKRKHVSSDDEENDEKNQIVDDKSKIKQKERTEELWSKFLSDVKPSAEKAKQDTSATATKNDQSAKAQVNAVVDSKKKSIFGDAATKQTVVAVSDSVVDKPVTAAAPVVTIKKPAGLAGILDKISNKPKISTLEKSRLDWTEFKQAEKIEDELSSHSKGKASYLERKAFLERTDYREFEREKDLRDKERKLRDLKK